MTNTEKELLLCRHGRNCGDLDMNFGVLFPKNLSANPRPEGAQLVICITGLCERCSRQGQHLVYLVIG
jgi:hypothetical protein